MPVYAVNNAIFRIKNAARAQLCAGGFIIRLIYCLSIFLPYTADTVFENLLILSQFFKGTLSS